MVSVSGSNTDRQYRSVAQISSQITDEPSHLIDATPISPFLLNIFFLSKGAPPISKKDPPIVHLRGVTSIQELVVMRADVRGQVITSAWDGQVKIWERPERSGDDPEGVRWSLVYGSLKGYHPVMLSAHLFSCAAFGDMRARNSLWIYDLEPPREAANNSLAEKGWFDEEDLPKEPPRQIRTCSGHTKEVCGLVKLDQGQILSYSQDCTIRLWSGRSFACKLVLKAHREKVSHVIQLKTGPHKGCLLSASWDKTLKLWPNPKFIT